MRSNAVLPHLTASSGLAKVLAHAAALVFSALTQPTFAGQFAVGRVGPMMSLEATKGPAYGNGWLRMWITAGVTINHFEIASEHRLPATGENVSYRHAKAS